MSRYRIVRDKYAGYEAQFRPVWCPFWFQCFGTNTRATVEESEGLCRLHATRIVKYVAIPAQSEEVNRG